jgi:hypothetical protein
MDVNGTVLPSPKGEVTHSFLTEAQQAALDAALEAKGKVVSMFSSSLF